MKPAGDITGTVLLSILTVLFVVAFFMLVRYIDNKMNNVELARAYHERWLFRQTFVDAKYDKRELYNRTYLTTKGILATAVTVIGAAACAGGALVLGTRKATDPAPN